MFNRLVFEMKNFLNKDVIIQNKKTGARYFGKIVGFRDQESRFCLSGLAILNKNGDVVAAPKYRNIPGLIVISFL